MNNPQEITLLINELAKKKGISINKMLLECGLKKTVIDHMKAGSMPSADKLAQIAEYLGVSTDYLLKGEEQKTNSPAENIDQAIALLNEKEGIYLHLAQKAKALDMTLDDVNFILGMYEKYKK